MRAPDAGPRRLAAPAALSLILLTLAAAPLVASWRLTAPAAQAGPARDLPGLPQPQAGAPATLSGDIDALPLITTTLPDPASTTAAQRLKALRLLDGPAGRQAFTELWAALPAQSLANGDRPAVDQLGAALLTDPVLSASGEEDASTLQIDQRLAPLAGDPANAERLNNAGLALVAMALAQVEGAPAAGVAPPAALLRHASTLLDTAAATFPESRSLTLDHALFARLPETFADRTAPLPALERWVNDHPHDRTARYLLAHQLVTGGTDTRLTGEGGRQPSAMPGADDRADLARALEVVRPLLQEAPALGYAVRGDAELEAADQLASTAPGAARESAWAALGDYDRALSRNADPGLYAGRGAALDAIAGPDPDPEDQKPHREAVRSLQVAQARQPESMGFALQLANLEEKAGDVAAMRGHARQALAAAAKWQPTLSDLRLTAAPRPLAIFGGHAGDLTMSSGDRGFRGSSLGSGSPQLAVWPLVGLGGGGYEPSDDLVPASRIPDLDIVERSGSPLDAGASAAIRADILLGDTGGAARDQAAWDRAVAPAGGAVPSLLAERTQVVHGYAAGATLIASGAAPAGADPDQALTLASTTLRRAGRYTDAAGVCERAATQGPAPDRAAAYECAGESWYLAGPDHVPRAQDDLAQARQETARPGAHTSAVADQVTLEMAAVQIEHQPDRIQQAKDALSRLAEKTLGPYDTVAWKELGDVALDGHDPGAALSAYDRAIASFDGRQEAGNPQAVAAARLAQVNRAIARVDQTRHRPEVPPCQGARDPCEAARGDLQQVLAQDPGDAVAHLDLAWVDRLLSGGHGDAREAESVDEVKKAVQMDPRLYAALGDLGVLQSEGGDREAARQDLEAAARGSPTYNVALRNLGVLELGDSPVELLRHPLDPLLAQGHLARATQLEATYGSDQLEPEFEQDARISPVGNTAGNALMPYEQTQAWTAAALGAFALLASLTGLIRIGGVPARQHGLRFGGEQLERRSRTVRDRLGRALAPLGRLPRIRHPWLVTLPVLAVLTIVSAAVRAPLVAAVLWMLFAVGVGVAARELGHWLWARWERLRSSAAVWGWGFPLSLLLTFVPLSTSVGPYVGHRMEPPDSREAFGVALAGVLTNVAVFVAAFTLTLVFPLPAVRLLAAVQLGIIAWSLLPFEPLDGWVLLRNRPILEIGIMAAVVAVAVALGQGGAWLLL